MLFLPLRDIRYLKMSYAKKEPSIKVVDILGLDRLVVRLINEVLIDQPNDNMPIAWELYNELTVILDHSGASIDSSIVYDFLLSLRELIRDIIRDSHIYSLPVRTVSVSKEFIVIKERHDR